MTNCGPVTTIFTPPPSCFRSVHMVGSSSGPLYIGHYDGGGTGCYPSATTSDFWQAYYWSPAICPSGWNTVASLTTLWGGGSADVFMGPGTSGYLCCPNQFSKFGEDHGCSSPITRGQVLTYAADDGPSPALATTTTLQYNTLMQCDGIPIVWQTTDLNILALISSTFSPSPSGTSTSSTPAPTQSASPSPPTVSSGSAPTGGSAPSISPPSRNRPSSSGLSDGMKVVAGVVPVGVIIFAALIVLRIFLNRRKRRNMKKTPIGEASETETSGRGPHEMVTKSNTPELLGKAMGNARTPGTLGSEKTDAGTHDILGEVNVGPEANDTRSGEEMDAEPQIPPVLPKVPIPPPKHPIAPITYELYHQAIPPPELDSSFATIHEMDLQNQSELEEILPKWVTAAELEVQKASEMSGSPRDSKAELVPSPFSTRHSISRKPVGSLGSPDPGDPIGDKPSIKSDEETDEQDEARLAVLRDRIERIRADKERLLEIQRLTQLEEETKAEILAATQRKSSPK